MLLQLVIQVIVSRGCDGDTLRHSKLWFNGPDWPQGDWRKDKNRDSVKDIISIDIKEKHFIEEKNGKRSANYGDSGGSRELEYTIGAKVF